MAAFTSKKQALHDMLAKTLVVREDRAEDTALRMASGSICPHCSSELIGGATFCNWCGSATALPPPTVRYAGFGRRAMAAVLDAVIVTPIVVFLMIRILAPSPGDLNASREIAGYRLTYAERQEAGLRIATRFLYLCALICSVSGAYSVLTESSSLQGTLGKRALGLRVTDMNGRRIRFGRALGRSLAHLLSTWLWFAGFIMAAFTAKRQTLHDILAGTLVVVAHKTMP